MRAEGCGREDVLYTLTTYRPERRGKRSVVCSAVDKEGDVQPADHLEGDEEEGGGVSEGSVSQIRALG